MFNLLFVVSTQRNRTWVVDITGYTLADNWLFISMWFSYRMYVFISLWRGVSAMCNWNQVMFLLGTGTCNFQSNKHTHWTQHTAPSPIINSLWQAQIFMSRYSQCIHPIVTQFWIHVGSTIWCWFYVVNPEGKLWKLAGKRTFYLLSMLIGYTYHDIGWIFEPSSW